MRKHCTPRMSNKDITTNTTDTTDTTIRTTAPATGRTGTTGRTERRVKNSLWSFVIEYSRLPK